MYTPKACLWAKQSSRFLLKVKKNDVHTIYFKYMFIPAKVFLIIPRYHIPKKRDLKNLP